MKRNIKYLFLLFVSFFICNINVNAVEQAYCYYNYTPNDSHFTIRKEGVCFFNCYEPATLVVRLVYHSEKISTPILSARIINSKEVNFSDGYNQEFMSEVNYAPVRCLNTDNICFNKLPAINVTQIRDNDNKIVCPTIYFLREKYTNPNSKPNYQLSLSSDVSWSSGDKFDTIIKLESDKNYSVISNEVSPEKPNTPTVTKIDCQYKYEDYVDTAFVRGSGNIGFSIYSDKSVSGFTATGILQQAISFEFDDQITDVTKCPEYINIKTPGKKVKISIGTSSKYDAIHIGKINNATENSFDIRYIAYQSNSSPYIRITKNGSIFEAWIRIKNEDKQVIISNFSNWYDEFDGKDSEKYPMYLNCYSDTMCGFSEKINKNASRVYIYVGHIDRIVGLGDPEVMKTCEEILGSTFIKFLKENVFKIVYIIVPIILILLTSFDFAKVVFIDDKDGINKSFKRFGKRCIVAILIYLIPTMIIFITNIFQADEVASCAKAFREAAENNKEKEV